jgi:hypothetical protein
VDVRVGRQAVGVAPRGPTAVAPRPARPCRRATVVGMRTTRAISAEKRCSSYERRRRPSRQGGKLQPECVRAALRGRLAGGRARDAHRRAVHAPAVLAASPHAYQRSAAAARAFNRSCGMPASARGRYTRSASVGSINRLGPWTSTRPDMSREGPARALPRGRDARHSVASLSARRIRVPDEHLPTSQFFPEFLFDVDRDELPQHLRLGRN